jgi:hypothetical protein
MTSADDEIVVEDADAPSSDSPPVIGNRAIDIAVLLVLVALALLLAFDNWRTGIGWAADGPEAGYFPFYLAVILAGASLYGLAAAAFRRTASGAFVTRDQLRRVLQVFVPTLLFCIFTQWLGLYLASFLLITGFMMFIGHIAWWKSLLTALLFSLAIFVTFELAFDVIMPKGPLEAAFGF